MDFLDFSKVIRDNVSQVLIGKADVVELLLVSLLTGGHVLMEDVPGIGKTTLAKALARSLDCSFARIQFTPDLLPSDVTGMNFYNQKAQAFEFRPGPVMNQIVLADEINRATPRTQSSLLEAMQERQVTVDGETYRLSRPFIVIATQNPIELEGTFPLPEAQIDRFLMQINLGYPTEDEEEEILLRYQRGDPLEGLSPVVAADDVRALQEAGDSRQRGCAALHSARGAHHARTSGGGVGRVAAWIVGAVQGRAGVGGPAWARLRCTE